MANKTFYTVFYGRNPGVYDNWSDALEQIENFPNARYKAFPSSEEATIAYRRQTRHQEVMELGRLIQNANERRKPTPQTEMNRYNNSPRIPAAGAPDYFSFPEIDLNAWAVDASCMGNPGVMEYRGVELLTGKELFRVGPFPDATNNIGEFLAIVHALALMFQKGEKHNIYSDSVSGMAWVRRKSVRTTLRETPRNRRIFELLGRALAWLNTHSLNVKVMKWETDVWGEIPADFGRK
ncbi:MAG: ribonuclease H family protein [Muribaculum sp.]|nr:ribonuclease H family protein [Muribaculum sp.]